MRDGPRTVRSDGINTAKNNFTGLRPIRGNRFAVRRNTILLNIIKFESQPSDYPLYSYITGCKLFSKLPGRTY